MKFKEYQSVVDAIKILKLRIRKKLVRFISKLKMYSVLKRTSFLRIRSLRIFVASTTGFQLEVCKQINGKLS